MRLTARPEALVALGTMLIAGCSTFAVISGLGDLTKDPLGQFLFLRALTIQPPSSPPTVNTFLFPLEPTKVTQIIRRSYGTMPTTSCMAGTGTATGISPPAACPGTAVPAFFSDSKVSADVPYEYTVVTSAGTRSRSVVPIDSVDSQVDLVAPGTGSLSLLTGAATPTVNPSNLSFSWKPLANKETRYLYGFFVVVGKTDTSSPTGIKPVYSAFLDEASHSAGVSFSAGSDLPGFSEELLGFFKGTPGLDFLSPVDGGSAGPNHKTLAPLTSGQYAWTVLTVDTNAASGSVAANTAYGIGKAAPPTDPKHYLFFQVN